MEGSCNGAFLIHTVCFRDAEKRLQHSVPTGYPQCCTREAVLHIYQFRLSDRFYVRQETQVMVFPHEFMAFSGQMGEYEHDCCTSLGGLSFFPQMFVVMLIDNLGFGSSSLLKLQDIEDQARQVKLVLPRIIK